jgi:hypothetical protein
MNIFVLDENPRIAAQMHCDKHIPKMIIEHAQMMAAAYYSTIGITRKKEFPQNQKQIDELFKGWPRKKEDGSEWHYSVSHVNHPCTVWTRSSLQNFNWLLECTEELCTEYSRRWENREHFISKIVNWMKNNPPNLKDLSLTPFAQAMPICYKSQDPINSYRRYYAFKTSYMKVQWKKLNNIPNWWTDELITESIETYIQ